MNRKKKKGKGGVIAALLLIAALAAAGGWLVFSRYVLFNGKLVDRDVTELDLRGDAVTDDELREAAETFPGVHVLYTVSIAGVDYSCDESEIVTGDFAESEIPEFSRFEHLTRVDATACGNANAILALREALPGAEVFWTVTVAGETVDGDATELTLRSVTAAELEAAMARLPYLQSVSVEEASLTPAEQKALLAQYPDMAFAWFVSLGGRSYSPEVTELTFDSDTPALLSELDEVLPLMQSVTTLRFDAVSDEAAVRAFAVAHENLQIVWTTSLFGVEFSTDAEELIFDDIPLTTADVTQIESLLPIMPNLRRVSMQRCGISNEDMDELYHRQENEVKFVWMVQVESYGVPTDQTYFAVYNAVYHYPSSNNTPEQLKYCHDMIAMDLGHLKLFGDPDMFRNMPHLKYLTVSNSAHESLPTLGELKELVWLELFWCNTSDITYLVNCTSLEHLNITYKRVRDAKADIDTLTQMTWLKRLWISANMYSAAQVQQLRDALPDTQIEVIYTTDCVSRGWRNDSQAYFDYRDALHMYYMSDSGNTVAVNPYTGERSQYEWTNPFR